MFNTDQIREGWNAALVYQNNTQSDLKKQQLWFRAMALIGNTSTYVLYSFSLQILFPDSCRWQLKTCLYIFHHFHNFYLCVFHTHLHNRVKLSLLLSIELVWPVHCCLNRQGRLYSQRTWKEWKTAYVIQTYTNQPNKPHWHIMLLETFNGLSIDSVEE